MILTFVRPETGLVVEVEEQSSTHRRLVREGGWTVIGAEGLLIDETQPQRLAPERRPPLALPE